MYKFKWLFLFVFILIFPVGCSPQPEDLAKAIRRGDISKVEELSSDKQLINAAIVEDNTPVTMAAIAVINEQTKIAVFLIEKGADVSIGFGNETLFSCASLTGNITVLKCIYKYHPDTDINHGECPLPPLISASRKGHIDVVKWLLQLPGIKVNIETKQKYTALTHAAHYGHIEIVKLLLKYGANINIVNVKNQTPLDVAIASLKEEGSDSKYIEPLKATIKYLKIHGGKPYSDL